MHLSITVTVYCVIYLDTKFLIELLTILVKKFVVKRSLERIVELKSPYWRNCSVNSRQYSTYESESSANSSSLNQENCHKEAARSLEALHLDWCAWRSNVERVSDGYACGSRAWDLISILVWWVLSRLKTGWCGAYVKMLRLEWSLHSNIELYKSCKGNC